MRGVVDSVAISEYLGVCSPEYEIQSRDIVKSMTDLPLKITVLGVAIGRPRFVSNVDTD